MKGSSALGKRGKEAKEEKNYGGKAKQSNEMWTRQNGRMRDVTEEEQTGEKKLNKARMETSAETEQVWREEETGAWK